MKVVQSIERTLQNNLNPVKLIIVDESEDHMGHKEARPGGESHFRILVVSNKFKGLSQINRQRLVYKLLAKELEDTIHALSLTTLTPVEVEKK